MIKHYRRETRTDGAMCIYAWTTYQDGTTHEWLESENDEPAVVYPDGTQEWYNDGKLHRQLNDEPAVIYPDGTQKWYCNGKPHREKDQPSIICANGDREWYWHGKHHRHVDLPSVINHDSAQQWFNNGNEYARQEPGQQRTVVDERYLAQAQMFQQSYARLMHPERIKSVRDQGGHVSFYGDLLVRTTGAYGKSHSYDDEPSCAGPEGYQHWAFEGEIYARMEVGLTERVITNKSLWKKAQKDAKRRQKQVRKRVGSGSTGGAAALPPATSSKNNTTVNLAHRDRESVYRLLDKLMEEVEDLRSYVLILDTQQTQYTHYINQTAHERLGLLGVMLDLERGAIPITEELLQQHGLELPTVDTVPNSYLMTQTIELHTDYETFLNNFFQDVAAYASLPRYCQLGNTLKPGDLVQRPSVSATGVYVPRHRSNTNYRVVEDNGQAEIYFLASDDDGNPTIDRAASALMTAMDTFLDEDNLQSCLLKVSTWRKEATMLANKFEEERTIVSAADATLKEEFLANCAERIEGGIDEDLEAERALIAKWSKIV